MWQKVTFPTPTPLPVSFSLFHGELVKKWNPACSITAWKNTIIYF
jgi:hypothetical protein